MTRVPLVIHERLGTWARQLRPRVVSWPVHLVETRSAADLTGALAGTSSPLVLLDLGSRPRPGLEDLAHVSRVAPNALVLVIDGGHHEGVRALARELGATLVLSGVATPPTVMIMLSRWLPLARGRSEVDGWSANPAPDLPPWQRLAATHP